jgi:hypothetical protein
MSGRRTIRWPLASTRVNVQEERELEFWSQRFRVSREMLKRAVRAAGPRFKDVETLLNGKR